MKPQSMFSPVSLHYIAALRGNKPKKTGTEFSYAEINCTSPESLICLAASNPEGHFYGFLQDEATRQEADHLAKERETTNVIFLKGTPSEILDKVNKGTTQLPMLDVLCCDERQKALTPEQHTALFDLAQKQIVPGGLFVSSYRAYDQNDGALRFLVRELAPEMNEAQKRDFLAEIKILGLSYLSRNPKMREALQSAISNDAPQKFFALFDDGAPAASETFNNLVAASRRGMAYAGDATMALNFVEMAVPKQAQDLIVSCRNNPLYEPIKDFALDRLTRSDIWVKAPFEQSTDPKVLFGGFAYGLIVTQNKIPPFFAAMGKSIDLSSPLFIKVMELMSIMPIGVGDALVHSSCKNEAPEKILEVFQLLVACGFASPMRGFLSPIESANITNLRLAGGFNRFIEKTDLGNQDVTFSSQVAGYGLVFPVQDAFVMQAIGRAGFSNSVTALLTELQRIANTPTAIPNVKNVSPTQEIAHKMILDIVEQSLPQWYAFAILEAA